MSGYFLAIYIKISGIKVKKTVYYALCNSARSRRGLEMAEDYYHLAGAKNVLHRRDTMTKKGLLVFVLVVFVVCGAFSFPQFRLSAGGGLYFTSDFGGGVETSVYGIKYHKNTPYFGGGTFGFFDATYVEANLGFFYVNCNYDDSIQGKFDISINGIDIGILGKYPFVLSTKLTLFPLLGITYRFMTSGETSTGKKVVDIEDLSALWFKFGGGLDYSFTDMIYLRGEVLYGLRLKNKVEKDAEDYYKAPGVSVDTLLGHGLEIKVPVGFRF